MRFFAALLAAASGKEVSACLYNLINWFSDRKLHEQKVRGTGQLSSAPRTLNLLAYAQHNLSDVFAAL